jgi:hypothetical protein
MFRKRRRPTPDFQIPPPFNPISGEYQDLRNLGLTPYCALMQVAAEDTYDDYVICRGFDPRMFRFVDYQENNFNKPGISVAKPFGSRSSGIYEIGDIYPALLPIQGTEQYTPPSPNAVDWRLGQNPGVSTDIKDGGQPDDLDSGIDILYDHNGKVVNWLIIQGGTGTGVYIPLNVTQVGGGPGTKDSMASWRYDVNHAITNESILTDVNPVDPPHTYEREPFGRLIAAKTGSGYYKEGVFIIDFVREPKDPKVC